MSAMRLQLQTGAPLALEIDGPYAEACGAPADNLVLKAAAAFSARVEGLRLGRFVLTKELPVASGIGGGSADAAAALRLLVHGNRQIFSRVDFADSRLQEVALAVGADVPVCLASRARIMRGVGEELLDPLDLPPLPALLVNPGVPLSTREVFARLGGKFSKASSAEVPRDSAALDRLACRKGNDLTEPAIACVPAIADVLSALGALAGRPARAHVGFWPDLLCPVRLGRSGRSGGPRALQAAHKGWWIQSTTLR